MRRMLFAAAAALLAFPLSAWAGPSIVRWDRVEGVVGADLTQVQVGPFAASTRWRSTGSGRVMLNLGTGFLSLRITGVSWAQHYPNGPLGSPTPLSGGSLIGTVVCNSTERFGPVTWVDTPVVAADSGSLTWQGFLDLPAACREYPEQLVFLVRHLDGPPFFGAFVLYGAERGIR